MAHFAGPVGAEKFLKTGVDNTLGTAGNAAGGIPEYVRGFGKSLGNNPEEVFKKRLDGAQHYGDYGLGRGVYDNYKGKDLEEDQTSAAATARQALHRASPPPVFTKEQLADRRTPSKVRTLSQQELTRVFAGSAAAAVGENKSTLAAWDDIIRQVGGIPNQVEILNRLRREGRGV